jgi:hypothetical protein
VIMHQGIDKTVNPMTIFDQQCGIEFSAIGHR